MIATLFLVFIFFVSIRTQSTTTGYISNLQPIVNPQANVTCNLTYYTVQSVQSPGSPTWVGNLVILSRLQIGAIPVIAQVGFLIEATFSGNPSIVDVLIYTSLPSGSYPGTLIGKVSGVNGANFANNLFGCATFNYTFSIGQFLWIGFYNYQSTPGNVISRQPRQLGPPYFYLLNQISPNVGSSFQSGAYNNEESQLIMGLAVPAPNNMTCSNITTCNVCTNNNHNTECVWCLNSQSCIDNTAIPTCPSWTRNPNVCAQCSLFSTCSTCASVQNHCSWCETNGKPSVCVSTPNDTNCTTAITNPIFCGLFMK